MPNRLLNLRGKGTSKINKPFDLYWSFQNLAAWIHQAAKETGKS